MLQLLREIDTEPLVFRKFYLLWSFPDLYYSGICKLQAGSAKTVDHLSTKTSRQWMPRPPVMYAKTLEPCMQRLLSSESVGKGIGMVYATSLEYLCKDRYVQRHWIGVCKEFGVFVQRHWIGMCKDIGSVCAKSLEWLCKYQCMQKPWNGVCKWRAIMRLRIHPFEQVVLLHCPKMRLSVSLICCYSLPPFMS